MDFDGQVFEYHGKRVPKKNAKLIANKCIINGEGNTIKGCDNDPITGNFNKVYGDRNTCHMNDGFVYGDNNRIYGKRNKIIGKNNKYDPVDNPQAPETTTTTETLQPPITPRHGFTHEEISSILDKRPTEVRKKRPIEITIQPVILHPIPESPRPKKKKHKKKKKEKDISCPPRVDDEPKYDETTPGYDRSKCCVVCLERKSVVVCVPCGHKCLCVTCANDCKDREEKKCYLCTTELTQWFRLYD